MPLTPDRKKVIRLAGLAVSVAGLALALRAFMGFVRAMAGNTIEGGPALMRFPEYYRQVGAYYSRGFITGFFACYFLMMVAIIIGTWVDEIRRTRRAARSAEAPAIPRLAAESAIQK
jgi:uncharacterized membrane protein